MAAAEEPWELIYWPGIKGRGEYVRLVFEEAGVPYVDVGVQGGMQSVIDFCWGGGNASGFPVRAPPAIRKGAFVLSNTPVVTSYLGRQFGLYPSDPQDAAHVEQVLAAITDAVGEGRLAFHPKDFYASHKTQVEESKPYVKQYGEQRLPKYLKFIDALLARSPGPERFVVGSSITVADLTVYHYLAAAEQHYKPYYDAVDAPLAKAFQRAIAERPRIKAYLQSDRCQKWDSDSMM